MLATYIIHAGLNKYELVDASRVYSGIHKVRVRPATRSVVAT